MSAAGLAVAMVAGIQAPAQDADGERRFAELPAAVREDYPVGLSRIVADLANEDPVLAIEALRRIEELRREFAREKGDPDLLRERATRSTSYLDLVLSHAYGRIDDTETRLKMLREFASDADLAKEIEFGFSHFAMGTGLDLVSKKEGELDSKRGGGAAEDKYLIGLADFCEVAPGNLSLVLLLPGVLSRIESMVDHNDFRESLASLSPNLKPFSRQEMMDATYDAVPDRFHELIGIAWKLQSGDAGD